MKINPADWITFDRDDQSTWPEQDALCLFPEEVLVHFCHIPDNPLWMWSTGYPCSADTGQKYIVLEILKEPK
jgi:hypothetical protein